MTINTNYNIMIEEPGSSISSGDVGRGTLGTLRNSHLLLKECSVGGFQDGCEGSGLEENRKEFVRTIVAQAKVPAIKVERCEFASQILKLGRVC